MKYERGNISELTNLLSSKKKIVIITHKNPDGDAIGSSLALSIILSKKKHDINVIVPNGLPHYLKWLPNANDIIVYDSNKDKAAFRVSEADIIFCLDFNVVDRIGDLGISFLKSKSYKAVIDHHPLLDDVDFASYMFSDTSYSSTCEIMYKFIQKLGFMELIDKDIATCIYAGILTDTGAFRFSCTSSQTHKIVAKLIDKGADNNNIYQSIYDSNSIDRLNLLSQALNNLFLLKDLPVGIMYLSDKDLKKNNFRKGYTEGFVNYILSIKGIILGIFLVEDKKKAIIKMSFRSKKDFDVNDFANKNFNGGGHKMAAGGYSKLTLEDTLEKVKKIIYDYKDKFFM